MIMTFFSSESKCVIREVQEAGLFCSPLRSCRLLVVSGASHTTPSNLPATLSQAVAKPYSFPPQLQSLKNSRVFKF